MNLPPKLQSVVAAPTFHRGIPASVGRPVRLAFLPTALLIAMVLGMALGAVSISPSETVRILLYKLSLYSGHVTWSKGDENIIWALRLPRVLAAAMVGVALGVAGALFQAVLRNPLADPYVIGTSAGAQLGVTLAVILPYQLAIAGFGSIQVMAFVGALGTVLFVYGLARTSGTTPVVTLLLAGFVVSSFLISSTSFLIVANNRMSQIMQWTMGSLNVSELSQLSLTGPLIGLAALAAFVMGPRLDAMLLGEEHAAHLGIRVERLKLMAIIVASLLTALAVTLAGVVAFVGLIVPHAARLLYGPDHRVLIPTAAVGGALFLVVADLVARATIPPTEIPLGVVTAVVGAPFFLYLLRQTRRAYGI